MLIRRWAYGLPLGILLFLLASLTISQGIWLGGYVSQKAVGFSGLGDSYLVMDRQGISSSGLDVSLGPRITTLEPTGLEMDGGTHATLRGEVVSLNNFPGATVWFEWGYTSGLGTTVGSQVVADVGEVSFELTGYNPDAAVFYRFAGSADGNTYGIIRNFKATGMVSTAYRLTQVASYIWVGLTILAVLAAYQLGAPLMLVVFVGFMAALLGSIGVQVILAALRSWW